jgi:hypothetical protein
MFSTQQLKDYMQETRVSKETWAFCLGTLLLVLIIAAVAWSEYQANHIGTWIAICAGGFVFCFIGFTCAGKGARANPQSRHQFAEGELCLREFYFNGYWFQPYEQNTACGGKQFRLSSTPQISPDREAAVIRYLIHEGLGEKMWPQISSRIEEEANWAFFA